MMPANTLTMSSREIAELTGKRHDHVMRDIRKMLDDLGEAHPTYGGSYEDSTGRTLPCFNLDRDMTDCLLTGYSAKARMMVIKRWRELESKQVPVQQLPALPQSFAEALQLAADQARQIEQQEKALTLAAPKADFYDAVTGSDDCIDMAAAAKTLAIKGIGRTKLFKFLRDHKILQNNNQPYQEQVDAGRFRVIESKWTDGNGDTHINLKTVVYQKGLDYIRKLIEKEQE